MKPEIGKFYNHNPNHYRFARNLDSDSNYVSLAHDDQSNWVGVVIGVILIALIVSVLYYFDFYSIEV
jgi:uncharacterized membrane protein YdbT with pleckstrin-like domain